MGVTFLGGARGISRLSLWRPRAGPQDVSTECEEMAEYAGAG